MGRIIGKMFYGGKELEIVDELSEADHDNWFNEHAQHGSVTGTPEEFRCTCDPSKIFYTIPNPSYAGALADGFARGLFDGKKR